MPTPLEHILTHAFKNQMEVYVREHPECIEELIQLAMGDQAPYNWRAAWLLNNTMQPNDPRVQSHLDEIISCLPAKEPNHQRELMRVMLQMEFTEEQEGKVFDLAVNNWERLGLKPAVRYIAFRMILKIASKYPELQHEIDLLTQEHYLESLSPGVKHSIGKMVGKGK